MPRLQSEAAIDRPQTTYTTLPLPPFLEVVWQQPPETNINIIHRNPTTETHNNTRTLKVKPRSDVESQSSPMKGTSPQVFGSVTEPLLENQTRSAPVQCLNDFHKSQPEIQEINSDTTSNHSGHDNVSSPRLTASYIEERLVRDENTN